uniref:Macro domain-containing protein n=2 Tax=Macrostomum lignano TaxID=282301 RepID=A0A1I8GUF9_9PLAT
MKCESVQRFRLTQEQHSAAFDGDAAVGPLELTVIAMPGSWMVHLAYATQDCLTELHAYHPNRFNSGQSAEPLHAEILAESPAPDVARRLAAMIGRRVVKATGCPAFVGLGLPARLANQVVREEAVVAAAQRLFARLLPSLLTAIGEDSGRGSGDPS